MIDFKNITFGYNKKQTVIEDLSLHINTGECALVLGESGSGKSTVIKMINGLIPHFYKGTMHGSVTVCEMNITNTPMYKISEKVGSVFQNPKSQFFNSDVSSEIAFPLENAGFAREAMQRRIDETVDFLDIKKLTDKSIFQLSGGEKQRIAIASVCALQPDIYTLDEPSANLDYEGIDNIKKMLVQLKESGKTIVISEHRIFYLMDIVDKIVFIEKGRLAWQATRQEFLQKTEEELHRFGLRSRTKPTLTINEYKPSSVNVFALENIHINRYKSKEALLNNISVRANYGDIIGIVGKNGRGKTTLMNTVCGLHPYTQGTITWHGVKHKGKKLSEKAYMVMQDASLSLFCDTVLEECLMSDTKLSTGECLALLKEFELDSFKYAHPMILSGGQKQRLAIIVSQLMKKELLVFDEPTSGLDYANMVKVSNLIKLLAAKGKIIFLVSHDRELLNLCCNELWDLDKGKF
ncbi:MAG: ABC transporter ATP-binding protein [Spirochaetales bacterium]